MIRTAPLCQKCGGQSYLKTDKLPGRPIFAYLHCFLCGFDDVPLGPNDLMAFGLNRAVVRWILARKDRSLCVWNVDGPALSQEAEDVVA